MAEIPEPPKYLVIARWGELFENNRSRDMVTPWWVPLPIWFDLFPDSWAELMERPDGLEIWGVFVGCVMCAAKVREHGALIRDSGAPHTRTTLARWCRIPAEKVRDSCEVLLRLGWLQEVTITKDARLNGAANVRELRGKGAARVRDARGIMPPRGEERRGDINTTPQPPSGEGGGLVPPTRAERRAQEFAERRRAMSGEKPNADHTRTSA
jgi:hypothetical protein